MSSKNVENRTCQNCKKDFVIEQEDFNFYEKMKVPPPTWCPECRRQRRWVWRNERTYYKRKCDVPGHFEKIISLYSQDSPYVVYDQKYWWGDKWNPLDFGKEYDFSKSFFQQYKELLSWVPFLALSNTQAVNSEYCSSTAWNKDCYLLTASGYNEKILYSNRLAKVKDSIDLYIVDHSELCYEDLYCNHCYKLFFSKQCENCNDSIFLYDCKNCQNCFGCANLRGQSYCFFNQKLSKKEYEDKINKLNLRSWKGIQRLRGKFYKEIYLKAIHKYADLVNSKNSTGDYLHNVKNCHHCYDFSGDNNENCKFVDWGGFISRDLYDSGPGVCWQAELVYESIDNSYDHNMVGCIVCYNSNNCFYSAYIKGSNNLFGCHGLHSKQYCILNKQYTKEEYEQLVPKIIKHMNDMPYIDKKGRIYKYGEFFPPELSPFCYNETIAQEYFPITKDQAMSQGFKWTEPGERNYQIDFMPNELPDKISEVDDDIVGKVIACEHQGNCMHLCTTAFKIIEDELSFYKKMNIPLPRLCPNCRTFERLKQRNPLKLWHRKCMKDGCENEFETSYAPERPEVVYCEGCYNREVY